MVELKDIVNLDIYPIDQQDCDEYKKIVNQYSKELDLTGCCSLPNFIKKTSLERMLNEIGRKRNKVYWASDKHNPYFTKEDKTLSKNHPKRMFQTRHSGYVNSNILDKESDLRILYTQQTLVDFVSNCLKVKPIYCWEDPLGSNPYSLMDPGHYFPWHFDGNEFTLSILIQKAEKGGIFEYVQDLRSPEDENFEEVRKVLEGNREKVNQVDLNPGDLQIFKGRFSMHRVTQVEGNQARYIALPTYVKDPKRVNKPEHSKQVYGDALAIHYERAYIKADKLTD
jgi:hypothetical protein